MINFSSSWDDGLVYDLQLVELLRKYKIPATFYIPTCCEILPEHIKDISKDFEIGGHTKTHPPDLKHLSRDLLYREIYDNKKWLEYTIGRKITKFCYPRGRYNQFVIDVVKDCGFKEARTTVVGNLAKTNTPFETPTTVHAFPRKEYNGVAWITYAKQKWDEAKKMENAEFHLWGHSKELFIDEGFDLLEDFFKYIYEDLHPTQN